MTRTVIKEMPRWRLFGWSEIWRGDSTGTADLYLLGVQLWRKHFTHSTWLCED